MSFLNRVLDPPSYGFLLDGIFYKPTTREIFSEFFKRLNIFQTRKNWLSFFSWMMTLSLAFPLILFCTCFFSWKLLAFGFIYSMVVLGSHGTFWLHRFSTHQAFQFRNRWVRFIASHFVIKIIPEEVYVVSHHVHHQKTELPGDPYNVHGGWLYCFLADVNHQALRKDLTEAEYATACKLISHSGIHVNSYERYLKWGSLSHPFFITLQFVLNWAFWYGVFFLIGGHALSIAVFGMSGVWAIGVRTFNFDGHGANKDKRKEGSDFNRKDLSVNQIWPGYVSGEWHNNHHLFPRSAKCGFLAHQLDIPWMFIRLGYFIGAVSSYRNDSENFFETHYNPFRFESQREARDNRITMRPERS